MRPRFLGFAFALAVLLSGGAGANESDFATWLAGLRRDALAAGIRPATLDATLTGLQPIQRVLELDRRQPERVITFDDYLKRTVTAARIDAARARLASNRMLLDEIAGRYGVQPRFIVALWGIESDFGRAMGGFPVIPALATLAYDGRRSEFFRRELLDALRIVDRGDARPEDMIGSWAGAMGQSQFMPSTYLAYAVGFAGDGPRDIWHSPADVFASIANYLAHLGWHGNQGWGGRIRLPAGFDRALIGLNTRHTLAEWGQMGVRRADASPVSAKEEGEGGITASIVEPGGAEGPAYLVYDNYRAVMKWNSSYYFATAVGCLADRLE